MITVMQNMPPPKVLIVLVIVIIVDNYESLKHASKSTNSISNSWHDG